MRVLECKKIDDENFDNITYIRIEPEDLSVTISDILASLSDLSWIAKFDQPYVRNSFKKRAKDTANYLTNKIMKKDEDVITKNSGEYIVSELARKTLVSELEYKDIPLAELFKEQVSGNPGFDFYSANKEKIIIFGEAKYNSKRNAYGVGMEQVDRFIREEQDLSDLNDVDYDRIVFDTYDYLDKIIGFKLSDIFFAAFNEYFEKTNDIRAKRMAQLVKYGTEDNKEIWMLRYGFTFEDMLLTPLFENMRIKRCCYLRRRYCSR